MGKPAKRKVVVCHQCQGLGKCHQMRAQTHGIPWGMHGRVSAYSWGDCSLCEGTGKLTRLIFATVISLIRNPETGKVVGSIVDNPEYDKLP